jgi:beta-glucosidase
LEFPRNVGQVPIYYNPKNTGRPFDANNKYSSKYLDVENTPLYVFGHGLSYTNFEYSKITIDKSTIKKDEKITVSVEVQNTGKRVGEEVVQLYIRDLAGSITRPVKELKAFEKVMLKPGEKKNVKFEIGIEELSFYNEQLKLVAEPGEFRVFVGSNSQDNLEAGFILE